MNTLLLLWRRLSRVAAFLLTCFVVTDLFAQSNEEQREGGSARDEVIEEELPTLIVRGEKDKEIKQSRLTSVSKMSESLVEDLNIQDIRAAFRIQANTYITPSNSGNNGITLRGINSEGVGEPGANSRPLTTLIIDGAPQSVEGVRRGQRGTWDIQAIEIARGPQSTLQGRNTMAGSVTVNTNDPTDYWEVGAKTAVGQNNLLSPAFLLSGPIGSGGLAFRVAAESSRSEKNITYTEPATEFLKDDDYRNVRGKLRYRFDSITGLEAKLTVSHTFDDPAVPVVSGEKYGYDYRDRIFDATATAAERRRNKVRNNVLAVSYEPSERWSFTSTTAFIETDAYLDGVGASGGQDYNRDELRSDDDVTQTFRYSYDPGEGYLSFEVGAFLGEFENDRDSLVTVGTSELQNLVSNRKDKNAAVFGEVWVPVVDSWQVIFGLRLETEKTDQVTVDRGVGKRDTSEYTNNAALPKLGFLKTLNSSDTLGLTFTTGYRGGFRDVESIGFSEGHDVDPEHLTNAELAYRSNWLGDDITFNLSVFYNLWKDQQVTMNNSGNADSESASVLTTTYNAGKSHSYGAEIELFWNPTSSLDVGASLGYLKTEFDEFDRFPSVVGNEFPEAPRASGGVWVSSRFAKSLFVSSDLSFRSSAYATSDVYNLESRKIPGYAVVGLRGGYEHNDNSLIVYIENLFDRDYLVGRDRQDGYYIGDDRTIGLTATVRY